MKQMKTTSIVTSKETKKKHVKYWKKSVFALGLTATMLLPGNVSFVHGKTSESTNTQTNNSEDMVIPQPVKSYDFNQGLQELMLEDDKCSITESKEVYVQKSQEELEQGEYLDANGIVYVISGDSVAYKKQKISNQPTTAYDEEKGTVLKLGKTHVIPAITKMKSAGILDENGDLDEVATAALDQQIPIATGAAQEEYTSNSELVISNPYGTEELAKELQEYDEYYEPNRKDGTMVKYGDMYKPLWKKGVTISYWIKVPSDEKGEYKPSGALRWELQNQNYYQADDYAKYLASSNWFVERKNWTKAWYDAAAIEESKTVYGSMYFFKYLEIKKDKDGNAILDASGAPIADEHMEYGYPEGPVYDSRFMNESKAHANDIIFSKYFEFNPYYKQGYYRSADGTYESIYEQAHFKGYNSLWMPEEELREKFNIPTGPVVDVVTVDGVTTTVGRVFTDTDGKRYSTTSMVRRAMVDGELQIDVDDSVFWVPDNMKGINQNPNNAVYYGTVQGMQNGDCFFMNSWQESQNIGEYGGDYQSALGHTLSPVTSLNEEGDAVKNGNCDTWHQVTVTLQNDCVDFYVDGVSADVENCYSSRGGLSLDSSKSFKRLNKGAGFRYCYWGSEAGMGNLKYGNFVCRLLMDWLTDEESLLHIGGAGQYAEEYNQATGSCEFSIDDIKFYGELLTEEQIVAAYKQEVSAMNQPVDVTGTAVLTTVTDISVDAASIMVSQASVEGKVIDVIQVAPNTDESKVSGGKLSNPFAGKELEGATISYWVKQDDAQKSSALSFVDKPKYIHLPDGQGEDASSILYIKNDGEASFVEGYGNKNVCGLADNFYTTAPLFDKSEDILNQSAQKWSYRTITMTNAGIKYYVDGVLVENMIENVAGERFLDGYLQRLEDESYATTRYGAFGKMNKQGAATLMSFLTNPDTELYLGYYPMRFSEGNSLTSGCSFAGIRTVDEALSDEEVKIMYENRLAVLEETIIPGDVTGDRHVKLEDAQKVLRASLLLTNLEPAEEKAADVDKNGEVQLKDAQLILRFALLLIDKF